MSDDEKHRLGLSTPTTFTGKELDTDLLKRLKKAMDDYQLHGTKNNIPYRPYGMTMDDRDLKISRLEAKVRMLEDQMDEVRKVLKFFKPFLPDE